MANARQILNRLRATQNISKVTHTMETISAVRYRHYYRKWQEGVEFYDALARMAYLMVTAEETIRHPLMEPNSSTTNAVVIIGSDRGLCGAYNSNLFRLLDVHLKMARRFGRQLKVYARGKKVVSFLEARKIEIEHVYDEFDEVPSATQAREMSVGFMDDFLERRIGRLGVIYNRFYSVGSQQAQTLTLLPVTDLIDDLTTRATVIWPYELAFEDFLLSPGAEDIFESLAHMMVATALSGCFLEASLSEHLGRVVAMRSASDNAQTMMDDLNKEYNRARQSQITTELLDIIGGVEAAE